MNTPLRFFLILVAVIFFQNTLLGQTTRLESFKIKEIDSIPVYYLIYALDSIGKNVIILSERQSKFDNSIYLNESIMLQTDSSYFLEIERTVKIYTDEARKEYLIFNRHMSFYIGEKLVADKTNLPYIALNLYGLYIRDTNK